MIRLAKRVYWRLYRCVQERRWFRRLMTRNYRSGKVSLGEKNRYGIRPEWITVDLDAADVNVDFRAHTPLPFADNSQLFIYSAHMVEHIDEDTLWHVLRESYRILKPSGAIRIEAPDLERAVEAFRQNDLSFFEELCRENRRSLVVARGMPEVYAQAHATLLGLASSYVEQDMQVPVLVPRAEVEQKIASLSVEEFGQWCVSLQSPQQRLSGGHVTPMYFEKLRRLLAEAGFKQIARRRNGETTIPRLKLWQLERGHREFCSFYVEAHK